MNKGLEIKRLRKMKGLTQLQLSQKLFVDIATISKYERNILEVKTNLFLTTLISLDVKPVEYIKDLVEKYDISFESLSKITFTSIKNISDLENIKDLTALEVIVDRLFIYIESIHNNTLNKYCFNRGDIVLLSDVDDWQDIKEEDKKLSAKFKVISRELDEDNNEYYSVISLQTNEIFEGYSSNFENA